ncbi:MAG: YkgJ family cysteine cluster protein [Myxococcota bacterium]
MSRTSLPAKTQWDCGGCTACCRHFALGPVRDEIIQGLHDRDVQSHWAPAKDGFAQRKPGPSGPAWFFTRRPDGACVFLQDDGLCAIHARWGADAKPAFCQEYPFTTVQDGDTLRTYVRADCGGWAATFESGAPAGPQAEAILDLPHQHELGRFHMDPLPILPGLGIDMNQWEAVESHLISAFEASDPEPAHTIRAALEILAGLAKRPLPAPDPHGVEQAVLHVAHRVQQALEPALAHAPTDPDGVGMAAFLTQVVELVRAGQRNPPRPLSDGARRYVAIVLRSQLHGRAFQALGGIPGWLGTVFVGIELARRAEAVEGPVPAAAFGEHLATWIRLTRHDAARQLLADLRPTLEPLVLRVG